MKRGCLGHPQALTLDPLGFYWGVRGTSPSLSFCPFFILWHHSSLPTLENFLHTKINTILISNVSAIKIINPLEFRYDILNAHIKRSATITHLSKRFFDQENSKERSK